MSLLPQVVYQVPDETARVARAAFPRGNPYLRLAEALGTIYQDGDFAALFPLRGQPATSPMRLALATVLQFAEGLSDQQAAEAVRGRIDWKYLLCLPLTDPGFDASVLSEFRARLVAGGAQELLLEKILTQFRELGLLKARGRQRTDSTHVLAAVRMLNRLERVGETMRAALNSLATVTPEWLRQVVPLEWYERYERRIENYQLPKTDAARAALGAQIGADGWSLLTLLDEVSSGECWRELPAVKTLRQVWGEQYSSPPAPIRWRKVAEMPGSAELIASPYDVEARWSTKRGMEWVGYQVHLTETCDPDTPHLITQVTTTPATTPDDQMLEPIHEKLAARELLPEEHLVDKGYTTAELLVSSPEAYGVQVIGPVADDPSWQARAGSGFSRGDFIVDWEAKRVTCPAGQQSSSWLSNQDETKPGAIRVAFSRRVCTPCAFRAQCTKRKLEPRELMLQRREEYEAMQARRRRQTQPKFRKEYAARAGIEGTHSQGLRRCGLRQARYIGLAKTHLQHVLTAAAINLIRVAEWLAGTPLAKTRVSPFAELKPSPA
jgi:transposase